MKNSANIILLCLTAILIFQSCNQKTEVAKKQKLTAGLSDNQKDTIAYKSVLRAGQQLQLGKTYSDHAEFIKFDDNGDDFYFVVRKNKDTIGLIYNQDNPQITNGSTVEIQWKIDSLRPAGDPEYLDFTEYLVSWKVIKNNNRVRDFSKLKLTMILK